MAQMLYREFRFFSPVLGRRAARISSSDKMGGEYFAIVPMDGGSAVNKERREAALEAIDAAIRAGRDPGEVEVPEENRTLH